MNSTSVQHPLIKAGVDVQVTGSGAVVEDTSQGRVHYLNPTAAFVLAHCDGQTSPEQIAALAMQEFKLQNAPGSAVARILRQFAGEGLLTREG